MDLEELQRWFHQGRPELSVDAGDLGLGATWAMAYALALQIGRLSGTGASYELCKSLRDLMLIVQEEIVRGRK